MPQQFAHPTTSYRILTWILFPAAFLFTSAVALKYRNLRYWRQRLGIFSPRDQSSETIWCHCASVGEINTALPLFNALVSQGKMLLISTNTITGHETLRNSGLQSITAIFLPLDFKYFAKRLLATYSPSLLLLFETELWPALLLEVQRQSIPVAIVNGRVGSKTLNAPMFLRKNYQRVLANTARIFASSKLNAINFEKLGAAKNKIEVLDNLKFAMPAVTLVNASSPLSFSYLLCASTHANEEEQIIHEWKKHQDLGLGLVIAIRHPKRANEVCKLVKNAGMEYVLHSMRPANARSRQVYIIDTLGELAPFMKNATIVFIGGSLVPIGGHNILEPARLGRCTLIGHHHQNFSQIVNELQDCKGVVVVETARDLFNQVEKLNNDEKTRTSMQKNARQYVERKQKILEKYTQALGEFMQHHLS